MLEGRSTHPEPGLFHPLGSVSNIDTIKQPAMPTPLLPRPTTILTSLFHSIPLSQLPLSSHRSHLFFSHLLSDFFSSAQIISLHQHYSDTALLYSGFCLQPSQSDSLAGLLTPPLVISPARIPRHPLHHQTEVKRSTG